MFPDSFATPRLRAERLTRDHLDALRAMDADAGFMSWLGGVRNESETEKYLVWNLAHWAEHGFGLWVVRDAAGQVAGRAALRHLDVEGTDEVELGYGFFPRYWGQGLATEMAKTLLALGRKDLGVPRLVAITRHSNIGSQRVLEKTGLVYERDIVHEGVPHLLYRSR